MTTTTLIWFYSGSVYGTVEIYISEKDGNNKFCPACNLLRTQAERWSYINQNRKMSWKNEWGEGGELWKRKDSFGRWEGPSMVTKYS